MCVGGGGGGGGRGGVMAIGSFSFDLQWGKLKNGIYFQAIADILTKLL